MRRENSFLSTRKKYFRFPKTIFFRKFFFFFLKNSTTQKIKVLAQIGSILQIARDLPTYMDSQIDFIQDRWLIGMILKFPSSSANKMNLAV